MIEGPEECYQIATSAFHCILNGSLNEAAYNTYSAGVMEIRIGAPLVAGRNYSFDHFFFFFTLDQTLRFFFIFQTITSTFEK